jgi:3-deoxy-D-arabino-heptulosonate 7-phosphate (DAHP) synthase
VAEGVTITLPLASANPGRVVRLVQYGDYSNGFNVARSGSDVFVDINNTGVSSVTSLIGFASLQFVSDGNTSWYALGN